MSLLVKMTLSAALVLSIGVPFGAFAAGEKTKGRYKTALGVNVFLFFGTMIAAAAFMFSGNAFAAEETAAPVPESGRAPFPGCGRGGHKPVFHGKTYKTSGLH